MAAAGGAECSGIGDSVVVRRDIAAVAGTSASVADLLPDAPAIWCRSPMYSVLAGEAVALTPGLPCRLCSAADPVISLSLADREAAVCINISPCRKLRFVTM